MADPKYSTSVPMGKGITLASNGGFSPHVTKLTQQNFEPQMRRFIIRGDINDEVFVVPPHWHDQHDEIMKIWEGKLKVTLGSEVMICTPETGDIFIPRGVPHSLESLKGEPVVFTERTNPSVSPSQLSR